MEGSAEGVEPPRVRPGPPLHHGSTQEMERLVVVLDGDTHGDDIANTHGLSQGAEGVFVQPAGEGGGVTPGDERMAAGRTLLVGGGEIRVGIAHIGVQIEELNRVVDFAARADETGQRHFVRGVAGTGGGGRKHDGRRRRRRRRHRGPATPHPLEDDIYIYVGR